MAKIYQMTNTKLFLVWAHTLSFTQLLTCMEKLSCLIDPEYCASQQPCRFFPIQCCQLLPQKKEFLQLQLMNSSSRTTFCPNVLDDIAWQYQLISEMWTLDNLKVNFRVQSSPLQAVPLPIVFSRHFMTNVHHKANS